VPKLRDRDVEKNREKIEAAALRLFIRRGFYGTSVRDIAQEAGVSLGNIYNYYRTKEQVFSSLVRRYGARMGDLQQNLLSPLLGKLDAAALQRLARAVRRIVYQEPDYWRLMYIDVTEFENRHFAHIFRDLSRTLLKMMPAQARTRNGLRPGIDASLAFTAIYQQFFTYFLVEKLFGGKQHLGMPDDRAIAQLIEIYTRGALAGQGNTCQDRRRRA
jgi:AcrR family transcriptional regulator